MASIKPTNILDFNYGISNISESQVGRADPNLPESLPIRPSEKGVENRLLEIFKNRSFTAQLMEQFEPHHAPRQYLIPFLFREELKKAFRELDDNEERQGQGREQEDDEEEKWDPKRKKKIKKASKLLKDTEEAWLLLDMYQRSLLRG